MKKVGCTNKFQAASKEDQVLVLRESLTLPEIEQETMLNFEIMNHFRSAVL